MHPSLRPRHTYRQNDDDRVLPLVNVVFLLLIFFMIAGQLSRTDRFHVTPPESARGQADEPGLPTVEISRDGKLAFNGSELADGALASALAADVASGDAGAVRLKADGLAEARRVIEVMAILRDAGVARVELVARSGSE